ncbi:hypothetical protein L208DRAFT_1301285, partial [Tricholoma matsutake]
MDIFSSALAEFQLLSEHLCRPLVCSHPLESSPELGGSGSTSVPAGGGRAYLFSHPSVTSFIKNSSNELSSAHVFCYVDHVDDIGCLAYPVHHGFVHADLSLTDIVPHISKQMVQKIARIHKIPLSTHWRLTKDELVKLFEGHNCVNCNIYTSVHEAQLSASAKKKKVSADAFSKLTEEQKIECNIKKHKPLKSIFPPLPLTEELSETIVREWCKESNPSTLEESGCA